MSRPAQAMPERHCRPSRNSPSELRGTSAAEEQVALGDAWWARAETSPEAEQDNLRRRAAYWYRQAEPNLAEGLAGMKVKQRLEELAKLGLDGSSPSPGLGSVGSRSSGEPTAQAASLIAQAQQLIDRTDYDQARKKLLQISLSDQGDPQACFYLGLLAGWSNTITPTLESTSPVPASWRPTP